MPKVIGIIQWMDLCDEHRDDGKLSVGFKILNHYDLHSAAHTGVKINHILVDQTHAA